MKRLLRLAAMSLLASTVLFGCGMKTGISDMPDEEEVAQLKTIGQKVDGAEEILLTNETGSTIQAFFVKRNSDNKASDNLMEDADFTNKQRRNFYFAFSEGETYDVQFHINGKAYTMHDFPFGDCVQAILKLDGDVAYIEYQTKDGKTVSTLETESASQFKQDETSDDQTNTQNEDGSYSWIDQSPTVPVTNDSTSTDGQSEDQSQTTPEDSITPSQPVEPETPADTPAETPTEPTTEVTTE